MLNYYYSNIASSDPVIKFSALNAFRAILESKEKEKIFIIVQNALTTITSILLEIHFY